MRQGAWILCWLAAIVAGVPIPAQDDADCLVCHEDASLFEGQADADRLVVAAGTYAASVHGELGLACVDCHQDLAGVEDWPHESELAPADCSSCHDGAQEAWESGLHGYAHARGNERAPDCADCHGTHAIRPSSAPDSRVHRARVVGTCAECHGTAGLLTDRIVKLPQSVSGYARSVHGTSADALVAANCVDCHGVHDLLGPADPQSRIHPQNVAATCGACHAEIRRAYEDSIHGRALAAGISDSPTCSDCHGEHLILPTRGRDSRTHAARLATETCGSCHSDPVIIAKYNLRGGVVGSYLDSYHGWAVRRDYEGAATCVSCHTAHDVLPASHAESAIHPSNVVETCRQCHEGASPRFAESYTHESASITANPVNRVIRTIYRVAIALIIGGMILHNLVIMNYHLIERRRAEENSEWVRRFDVPQILQHLLLSLSFVVLVATGFALRFPEAWWVEYLTVLGMSEPVRADLHRIAAVVLIVVAVSHVVYLFMTRRGIRELRELLPTWRDVRDLTQTMRFYTWRTTRAPRYDRYDYSQKAEYWALIWGTLLMIVTGFVLWFPEQAVRWLPSWIIPASQTIHYYEAWLATLAILFWHFFFVIFHPEQYPMSWTWLTGKMPLKSVRRHHARWYETEIAGRAERIEPGRRRRGHRTGAG